MQKKLLVSVAIIISIITATTTSAQWNWSGEKDSSELDSDVKRLMEERKIDRHQALREILRRNAELLRKYEGARKAELPDLERLGEQTRQREMGLFAWKHDGYSAWTGRPSEKVEAERAAMAAFDCMFLAARVGAELSGDVERLFAYARERAKQALPYADSPYAFTPYQHPGTISDDVWIGTLYSDARARIDRQRFDGRADEQSELSNYDGSSSSKVWAAAEFDRRNCRFIGKP